MWDQTKPNHKQKNKQKKQTKVHRFLGFPVVHGFCGPNSGVWEFFGFLSTQTTLPWPKRGRRRYFFPPAPQKKKTPPFTILIVFSFFCAHLLCAPPIKKTLFLGPFPKYPSTLFGGFGEKSRPPPPFWPKTYRVRNTFLPEKGWGDQGGGGKFLCLVLWGFQRAVPYPPTFSCFPRPKGKQQKPTTTKKPGNTWGLIRIWNSLMFLKRVRTSFGVTTQTPFWLVTRFVCVPMYFEQTNPNLFCKVEKWGGDSKKFFTPGALPQGLSPPDPSVEIIFST